MKFRPAISLAIFVIFIVLMVGHNFPGFRSALRSLPFPPIPPAVMALIVIAWLLGLNALTIYQLWTGKASAWDWNSPQTGYQGWKLRSREPFSYWFRALLLLSLALFVDLGLIVLVVRQHG